MSVTWGLEVEEDCVRQDCRLVMEPQDTGIPTLTTFKKGRAYLHNRLRLQRGKREVVYKGWN